MGTWPNSLPSPEASVPCAIVFLSSFLSLCFLSPGSRHGFWLWSLAPCLFCLLVWDRLSRDAHSDSCTVSSRLFCSQPSACLRLPACLEQLGTHRGLGTLHYFGHKVTRKSMERGFLFLKEGDGAEKFLRTPSKVFQREALCDLTESKNTLPVGQESGCLI